MSAKKLVIGLGTGRSGTVSLAMFLDAQKNAYFVHEGAYNYQSGLRFSAGKYLPWVQDREKFETWYRDLKNASGSTEYYGDVCASLLSYVPLIIEKNPRTLFVCIKRNKHDTVESFMSMTKGINYWDRNNQLRKIDFWGKLFPVIDGKTKRESIELYWDYYYETVELLETSYPHAIKTFSLESLNTNEGQNAILEFIGYPVSSRVTTRLFHSNKRVPSIFICVLRIYMAVYGFIIRKHDR
jgi:hypothetical protein